MGDVVGYRLLGADGGVFAFGTVAQLDEQLDRCQDPYVAMTAVGGVSVFVTELGSLASRPRGGFDGLSVETTAPVVDVDAPPFGEGFWVMDRAGGVFSFGDAGYYGSIPGLGLDDPPSAAAGLTATPTGLGYWIVDTAGGVYCFGDAEFYGSTPGLRLDAPSAPAVDIAASPTGAGYAVLERDGTIRGFGDLSDLIEMEDGISIDAVAFSTTPSPNSYVVVDGRGFVYPVGTAPMFGSLAHLVLRGPVVDVVVHSELDPSAP